MDKREKSPEELKWEAEARSAIGAGIADMERKGQLTKKMALQMLVESIMEYQKIKLFLDSSITQSKETKDATIQQEG